jgi:hypothetical protein
LLGKEEEEDTEDGGRRKEKTNKEEEEKKEVNQNWGKIKKQIIEDLLFLYEIRNLSNKNSTNSGNEETSLHISLEESQFIEEKKKSLFQLLQSISFLESLHNHQFISSFLMMYDAIRLFTTDLSAIGIGTKDFTTRLYSNNLFTENTSNQLLSLLPKGLGELSPIEEYKKKKLTRFINRKMKALAAIERERIRRNMTEEDKEQLRLEKLQSQKKEFILEEKTLFQEALSYLLEIREKTVKDKDEIHKVVKCFEEIVTLKESRFPNEFQTQIARNNLSCVLYELYGIDHPLAERKNFVFLCFVS